MAFPEGGPGKRGRNMSTPRPPKRKDRKGLPKPRPRPTKKSY